MKTTPTERLRDILFAEGASPTLITRVLNRWAAKPEEGAWLPLIEPLNTALRTTLNSKKRWRPNRAPIYAAYVQLMERVKAELQHAQRTYPTPADAEKAATARNKERAVQGKLPLGECGAHWSTWVPPHIRDATCRAFETLYADETNTADMHPGRRVTPFSTHAQRGETQRKWERLLEQLRPHIDAGFDVHPSYLESATRGLPPERLEFTAHALIKVQKERYRAAYAARKIIKENMLRITSNFVVPLHWTHVLDDDARAHLRAAEREAGGDGYTRDVGLLSAKPPTAATPSAEDYIDGDPETRIGPDSIGYIAPRPPDRLTAMSEETAREKAKLDAFYAARDARDAEELRLRLEGDDL